MLNSQKHVFWQALLVTFLIFLIGIFFGVILENFRIGKIDDLYQKSEINLLDIKLQTEIYSMGNFNCEVAVNENFEFAERIYKEALLLERYQSASNLKEDLNTRHRKYDLLRANLFLNSLMIKEKCNESYKNVVYLYKMNNQTLDIKAKQNTFSKLLYELKKKMGNSILLIPIAGDNNLVSVNLIMDKFNITKDDLPVILINEKIKVKDLQTIEELEKYFK
ncbi:MAG: hypothetical protein QXW97_04100 [Candidatus Pacearchaeota archaeon]